MSHRSALVKGAVMLVAVAAVAAGVGGTLSAFTSIAQNTGSEFSMDTLAAPANLTASNGSTVPLSWTASPSAWASGYRVYRATTSGGPYSPIADVVGQATTTYNDTPGGGTFYYVVRAYYAGSTWVSPETNEVSASTSTYASTVLGTASLRSYWRLGESEGTTAADSKGTNHGTYENGVTLGTTGALNETNTAATFDGADDGVSVPNATNLRPARITVEAWVKGGAGLEDYDSVVLKTTSNAWDNGYGLYWTSDGNIHFFVNHWDLYDVATSLPADEWTHIVGTYNGSQIRIFKNGVLAASLAHTLAITHSTTPLMIGAGLPGGAYSWSGDVDEVAVYNAALGAAAVTNHYNAR
jgi:hypothetical protein